jgi:hypothetical protein
MLPSRFKNASAARERFGDRVDRLARHLLRSDAAADEAVQAIDASGRAEAWTLFERGLRGEAIPDAPAPLRELIEACTYVPAWVDWPACDRGGEVVMRAGPLGGAVLGSRSLVLGYASPGGNKPLVFSGRLKGQAGRRLDETARFVQAVCRPGGMRPFGEGWQITLKVRLIHAQVRKMILASGRWNEGAWGLPLNQHDLAGTTLLFSVSMIDGLRKLGMRISPEEGGDYIHLWRWVGRTIGVDEDVLPACEAEAMRLAAIIEATMGEPDDDSRDLTRALFESPYERCRTPAHFQKARRHVMFGQTVCRALIGDELADKLAVPRTPIRYALPLMRRFVSGMERVTRAVPAADRRAIEAGSRYWDRVVELGLSNTTYDFALPSTLAA